MPSAYVTRRLKYVNLWGWRNGSVFKSANCFCRGPEVFDFSACIRQLTTAWISRYREPTPFWPPWAHTQVYIYIQTNNTCLKINLKYKHNVMVDYNSVFNFINSLPSLCFVFFFPFFFHRIYSLGNGEDGSAVNSIVCSSEGPRFNSHHPHGRVCNSSSRTSETITQIHM